MKDQFMTPAIVSKAVRLAIPLAADRDLLSNAVPIYYSNNSSADEAIVEINLNAWTGNAGTFSSVDTLIQSDEERTDVNNHLVTSPHDSLASPYLQLSIQDFNIQFVIGQGTFGKVALTLLKGSQRTYAVKVVPKSKLHHSILRSQMLREQEVMCLVLGLPFLAGIEASFHDSVNFYLLMEYYPTSLHNYWHDAGSIPSELTWLWTAEMASSLNVLHVCSIVHHDFKLDNVLLSADRHVRVTDFGLAKHFPAPILAVPAVFANGKPIPGRVMYVNPTTAGIMGTWKYMAPELLLEQPYSYPINWWALGIAVYTMCSGHLPWDHSKLAELKKLILYTKVPIALFWVCDPELHMVVHMALEKNPMFRITFNTIQAMPFFCNINWACIGSMPIKRVAFTADKTAADAILADEQLIQDAIVSLDGEAPIFDAPVAWKAAFSDDVHPVVVEGSALLHDSEATVVSGSPASSHEAKAAAMSMVPKGNKLRKWWKHIVCKKECGHMQER
ncbi:hypothetical protein EWM64_g1211 [Hericium alpestre]|uniref:Protein kinase domain-containing protein n=1 Tax=Hericium alpestre TaxID=135208 RepID=A0A4Z0A911_9AGAM|nr:hypothetical protein EWM64_g1211 [Hericium alpestre]